MYYDIRPITDLSKHKSSTLGATGISEIMSLLLARNSIPLKLTGGVIPDHVFNDVQFTEGYNRF